MQEKIIGIMGAMPEEIDAVLTVISAVKQSTHAGRLYHQGFLNGIKTVVVISGWGKVAAAATVSTLIHKFNISQLIFTGVAGAINSRLHIGDIVIGKRLVQHDMDARPFIPQYEIPIVKKTFFETDAQALALASTSVEQLLANQNLHSIISAEILAAFNIVAPRLYIGDIASGDQFIADTNRKAQLLKSLPGILCVEMEGAAVAQVCYENQLPFTVIRTISDAAGDEAPIDFAAFIKEVAGRYSVGIIKEIFGKSEG